MDFEFTHTKYTLHVYIDAINGQVERGGWETLLSYYSPKEVKIELGDLYKTYEFVSR